MTDLTDTIEYYEDLLLTQYVDKPKARATIGVLVETALCDFLPLEMNNAFDIDTAVGDQLDILGEYIGFNRRVVNEITRNWYALVDYTTYNPATEYAGFTDYTDLDTNSDTQWYRYVNIANSFSDLTDDEYRYILKFKLILNGLGSSLYDIQNILFEFFGYEVTCYDLKNMTISYTVLKSRSYFVLLVVSQGLLPKPMGVGLAGVFEVEDPEKLYGFQDYTFEADNDIGYSDYLTGFNGYQWIAYEDKIA